MLIKFQSKQSDAESIGKQTCKWNHRPSILGIKIKVTSINRTQLKYAAYGKLRACSEYNPESLRQSSW